jgi:hypothetical protein
MSVPWKSAIREDIAIRLSTNGNRADSRHDVDYVDRSGREIAALRDTLVDEFGAPIWLHVDGAYGGMAAICPDFRHVLDGVEHADSFVTNPHKWLFTPIDASLLLVRDPSVLTRAFSLVPST